MFFENMKLVWDGFQLHLDELKTTLLLYVCQSLDSYLKEENPYCQIATTASLRAVQLSAVHS